ncbi:PREDICTED: ribonuclease 3-like [Lupinus angustifolius]|uniref:ribonuclease 3-like n=1 Tax=Lupinus angustifolius TaxID=3871 RepID=UPI00092E2EAC|nr:PREDICTED: ribonuclease 3-like [Lupinus angustifolius]
MMQWPGAYCNTKQGCCYPKTGKPTADFGIHGLWPNYKDGSWPSNCDPDSVFDKCQITELMSSMNKKWPTLSCPGSNGVRFWSYEWEKHGTCAESELDQREYFETALNLKEKINLLQILKDADIEPDDGFYSLDRISKAIKKGTGFTPGIECNKDSAHNIQLYQVYMCVDTSGTNLIECPILPRTQCGSDIQFPKF